MTKRRQECLGAESAARAGEDVMRLPRRAGSIAAALLCFGATSCADGARGGPKWLSARARPVTLELTIDTARAVTKTITARGGGTLSATGSDGTRYRLSFPDRALLSDATITLIPVRTVKGLPLAGGSIAAVHIEPSGLQLMRAATLTIRPVVEVPVPEQVAYSYAGTGDDAYQYPLSADPAAIEMKILHFSGYGFGRAAADDPGRQALQQASAMESRLQARVAESLGRLRRAALLGEPEDKNFAGEMDDASSEYYDTVLRPLMQRGETDERMAECCLQRYLGWERSNQLFGGSDSLDKDRRAAANNPKAAALVKRRMEAATSVRKILANAYAKGMERAVRQCREEHDLNAVVTLLALERQMQLLGVSNGDRVEFAKAYEAISNCLNFEVEFRSGFDTRAKEFHMAYAVEAKIPVDATKLMRGEYASGPLNYLRSTERIDPNAPFNVVKGRIIGTGTRPGTMVVHSIDWDRNPREEPGTTCDGTDAEPKKRAAGDTALSFTITFRPGVPTELNLTTIRNLYSATGESHGWSDTWARRHEREQVGDAGASNGSDPDRIFKITLPSAGKGVWRADFTRPDAGNTPGLTASEDGYLIVRHTPR